VKIYVCLLAVLFSNMVQAQDSTANKRWYVAPVILVSAGAISLTDNEVFDKWEFHEVRQNHFVNFRTHADDYIQLAPIAAAYAMDLFKVKGRHKIGAKTIQLLKSELIAAAMVIPLKHYIATPRPDTGAKDSFPSGHTAQAFAAATFFHKEYGHISIWYSVGAYAVATSVGTLRILNDRHWVSDVLFGAGIGILSTNLAYMTEKKDRHVRHLSLSHLRLTPYYAQGSFGLISKIDLR